MYAVAIPEIIDVAKSIVNRDSTVVPLILAAAVYLVLILILTLVFKWLERRFNHSK